MTRVKVAVTGASGRTGRLVVQRLLLEPERYEPVAIVRSNKAADEMRALFALAAAAAKKRRAGDEAGGAADANSSSTSNSNWSAGAVHVVDFAKGLTPSTREEDDDGSDDARLSEAEHALRTAFAGCRAVVVASSAVAEPKAWASLASAAHVAASRLASRLLGRAAPANAAFVPVATWKGGQEPREVDWLGARRIFRAFAYALGQQEVGEAAAAAAAAVAAAAGGGGGGGGNKSVGGHVVLISSAGGCDPGHFLNRIAGGEILNWKRLAEQELIRMCEATTAAKQGAGAAAGAAKAAAATAAKPAAPAAPAAPAPTATMTYTILHPNHLIDSAPGGGGKGPSPDALPASSLDFFDPRTCRALLAVDDALQRPHWSRRPRVPRALLAELSVQCVALAREGGPGGQAGWCEWEDGLSSSGGAAAGGGGALAAPARDRAVDVGAEARAAAGTGGKKGGGGEGEEARAAAAAAAAERAEAEAAAASAPGGMTTLFASLLRAMPRDCDYGINDRTAPAARWACAQASSP